MSRPEGRPAMGRGWRWAQRAAPIPAGILAVLAPASPAAADVDAVFGSATGVAVTSDLADIPSVPTVALSADEASPASALGPFTASVASVALPSPLPFNVFSTGALTASIAARPLAGADDTGSIEASTLALTVVLGPNVATASSIASSCTADAAGARGTTVIQGGTLYGQPFPPTPTPAPNTVIAVPGAVTPPPGFEGVTGTITLNEQVATDAVGPAGGSRRLVVTAVHARLRLGGGGVLPQEQSAEAVIGQVICAAAFTTPPATTTTAPPTTTAATTTPVVRGTLADTGGGGTLPLGVAAFGIGAALRRALRRNPAAPA